MDAILKMDSRILRPGEYISIRKNLKPHMQVIVDGLLYSHMRLEEYIRFSDNPNWYKSDRGVIDLPKGSILKVRARQKERSVILSLVGQRAIEELIRSKYKVPGRKVIRDNLLQAAERASIDAIGISQKMLRKTYISWLMATIPEKQLLISTSAGHDTNTMINHYLNIGLGKYKEEIKPFVVGWGE